LDREKVQLGVVSVMESGENWRLEGCKTASGVLSTSNQSTYVVGHRLKDLRYSAISWGAVADNSVGNNKCLGAHDHHTVQLDFQLLELMIPRCPHFVKGIQEMATLGQSSGHMNILVRV
jgi:hypothetical protein